MTEKTIRVEGIDLAELYGSADAHIERIKSKFPKLKVVARGSSIKAIGESDEIERFDRKLAELLGYYDRYGHLSDRVIDQIYDGGLRAAEEEPADRDAIVYGNNGLVVGGPPRNQRNQP